MSARRAEKQSPGYGARLAEPARQVTEARARKHRSAAETRLGSADLERTGERQDAFGRGSTRPPVKAPTRRSGPSGRARAHAVERERLPFRSCTFFREVEAGSGRIASGSAAALGSSFIAACTRKRRCRKRPGTDFRAGRRSERTPRSRSRGAVKSKRLKTFFQRSLPRPAEPARGRGLSRMRPRRAHLYSGVIDLRPLRTEGGSFRLRRQGSPPMPEQFCREQLRNTAPSSWPPGIWAK
jgi:hypothetical protein